MSQSERVQLLGIFFEEAKEHLTTMESTLLALESNPEDPELLNLIFRSAHSVKGASGAVGLEDVRRYTHALEGLLQQLREGAQSLNPALADTLLRATDVLEGMIAAAEQGTALPDTVAEMLAEIEMASGGSSPLAEDAGIGWELFDDEPVARKTYEIRFVPGRDMLRQGFDPLLAMADLAAAGEVVQIVVDDSALPSLEGLDPELCYLTWTMSLRTDKAEQELRDIFAFVEDHCRIDIASLDPGMPTLGQPETTERAAQLPVAPHAESEPRAGHRGQLEPEAPARRPPPMTPAAAAAKSPAPTPAAGAPAHSTVRVDTEKIDRLINLVGELVISHSMIAAAAEDRSAAGERRLREAIAAVERNLDELQYRALSVRMVSMQAVFARLSRLVRDTASSLGKDVALRLEGKDTEVDKEIVEKLADPLTHLIRNGIDHGIEPPDVREAAGKSRTGTVLVRARHQGGDLLVEVIDDGGGLNTDRIGEKARSLGLIAADADPSDEELHALIFAPGFSTAKAVSDVSGRGVGMDVVKRNVEALNGAIHFESERGQGSRFELRLPLLSSIIDGLVLRVGRQMFVLPLVPVLESLRPSAAQLETVLGQGEVVCVQGHSLPLVRLHAMFGIEGAETNPTRAVVCAVEAENSRAALLVDELISPARIVVKPLEKNFRRVGGVMGGTILGDGSVALIIDVPALLRAASGRGRPREEEQ
jgi:two-component system, chemotaxis family, sensor kinase CheA